MNPSIQHKKATPIFLIALALAFFGLSSGAWAVVPSPDGAYPNYTTAEGQNALLHLTTGIANTGVGWLSLGSVTTGSGNTGLGAGTLALNTADRNTATGAGVLLSNTTGSHNTANGAFALSGNTTGLENTAVGDSALMTNTVGIYNTAVGSAALIRNTTGGDNVAVGVGALAYNTTGVGNIAIGFDALLNVTTGSNNIALGRQAGVGITTNSNNICIGAVGPATVSDSCFIGNIFGHTTGSSTPVLIDSDGRLGTMTSSRRFKEKIKPMKGASEVLFALEPVTFRYKKEIDSEGTPQFGLVAEDVEKVNPNLVVRDKAGKPYSVRYDAVNAMLLNEFLKEHTAFVEEEHRVETLQESVVQQQKEIETLTADLQKVSAQLATTTRSRGRLELSKTEPRTILNNR